MKVVQALGWYFPESTGGTESYVRGLTAGLAVQGVENVVAAPVMGAESRAYEWEGTPVFRYPEPAAASRAVLRGERPPTGFGAFTRWLEAQGADLYHQHAVTTGCGLHHLRTAKSLGLATVLTIHVPGPVCPRGTMLFEGREACARALDESTCGRCWLLARGAGTATSTALSRVPSWLGRFSLPLGRAGSALGTTALVRRHRQRLLELSEAADRVVAVCQWLHDSLLRNGVPAAKLSLNRQGVAPGVNPMLRADPGQGHRPLVVGFLGRWDRVKGLPLLVEAVRGLPPETAIALHAHASNAAEDVGGNLQREVANLAREDARIHILPALAPGAVPSFLQSIDVLAVPSQWLETGPLVVLEALAAGTPVIGSRLGGISELVRDGENGLLVPHADAAAWRAALLRLLDPELRQCLRDGIGAVRTEAQVARETLELYREILSAIPARPSS